MSAGPLVYANARARADAKRLLTDGVVLEERVAAAIRAGSVFYGRTTRVVLGGGVLAVVRRVPGRLRGRPRAWEVLELKQDPRRSNGDK